MPDNPHAGEDVLHLLHVCGSPATVAQTGGRYFGFVNGNVDTGGFCENAAYFAEALKENGFWVLNDVVFNQVLVACQTPTETQRTIENIIRGGVCWCGGTVWEDRPAIRISVCSWVTTSDDIDASVQAFIDAREIVSARRGRKTAGGHDGSQTYPEEAAKL